MLKCICIYFLLDKSHYLSIISHFDMYVEYIMYCVYQEKSQEGKWGNIIIMQIKFWSVQIPG